MIGVDRNAPPHVDDERPQVVDAVRVVGVLVGKQDGIEASHVGVEELFAQIRRGVDQHGGRPALTRALDEDGTAPAAVFRIVGIAGAPAGADAGHAARRAASQDGDGQRHATTVSPAAWSAAAALANKR
jgi:hypothetical protein